jgi:succinate-semialdehyde dehydrogenase/glutarate-semialdehyde dehydrogenase
VRQGATVALGGERLDRRGYYFAPTVLTGVTPDVTVAREETFGPVAAVMRVKDEEKAIDVANNSTLGLGASIWSQDVARAKELARHVEAGNVYINTMVASNPRLPFGGVKASGWGRELSRFGVRELVNIKTVGVGPVD